MSECLKLCCANFPISPYTFAEIQAWDDPTHTEAMKIKSMVIPLPRPDQTADEATRFTCKHWDKETGLCTDYDNRPKMCSDYPYGRSCDHADKGCQYAQERASTKIKALTEIYSSPIILINEKEKNDD